MSASSDHGTPSAGAQHGALDRSTEGDAIMTTRPPIHCPAAGEEAVHLSGGALPARGGLESMSIPVRP